MSNADITLKVMYNLANPDATVIKTNAKKEAIAEILEEWLWRQGSDKDMREAHTREEYTIKIRLDLSDDTFYTTSDTGNLGLTCGIMLDVYGRLDRVAIHNL